MLYKYDRIKSHYRPWSENQLHIWVVKQLNMCSWVFTLLHIPELPIYLLFMISKRDWAHAESNSDKYILLKLQCLKSHQSNLKFNLMFDREPVYSLQDTLACWGHLVRGKFGRYHFAQVEVSAVFLRNIVEWIC